MRGTVTGIMVPIWEGVKLQRRVQDNQSFSTRNVLRGLRYQLCHPQGKLVSAVGGEIFDVAVGAYVLYKATDFYHPECERTLLWSDPDVKVDWQLENEPIISAKDALGVRFREVEPFT